jgi:hypothetical protein
MPLVDTMNADLAEVLFRFAETAVDDPAARARVQRAVKAAMRAAVLETRTFGTRRLYGRLKRLSIAWAQFRAERLARALGVNREDARDLGRIQDWEDRLLGVTGHWTVESPRCATKHETICPFSDLAAQDPMICTDLVHALETETFARLAPGYRLVPLSRLLSKGDGECTFRHELAGSAAEA